jgi:2-dehydro-3-deoxyphosphooctonate aldolase (KDO 8-P synthase)
MVLHTATELKRICSTLRVSFIFKSSFDKANRTSMQSFRGFGIDKGLQILQDVKQRCGVPIITDVHEAWQCGVVAQVADVLQIPAFLARQTDLLVAAAKTGKPINVKKAQFMAPWDMKNVIAKLQEAGSDKILLCERGSSFGYNNLVVDMTGLAEMRTLGYPIVFDATHSVQKPGGNGTSTAGNRAMAEPLMRAASAVGIDAIFAEVHPDPDKALSDAPNQLKLSGAEQIFKTAQSIHLLVNEM